jgi:hypothetical protein
MKYQNPNPDGNRGYGVMPWLLPLLASALALGCASSRAPILGLPSDTSVIAAPTVTAVAPVNGATGVPINNPLITAAFSEPMAPITGNATFTVTGPIPGAPTGTVALDASGQIATFTLTSAATLTAGTTYTARIAGATSRATGLSMAAPYTWTFTTGLSSGLTRPVVVSTSPATTLPGPTANVPANAAVTAVFSADMNPATLNAASFTVTSTGPGGSPAGQVSYALGSRTAIFTPAAALVAGTTYTAMITSAATNLAGTALAGNQPPALPQASNYVWTFTAAAAADLTAPTITVTTPVDLASTAPVNSSINATFSKPMNPSTLSTATFTVRATGTPLGAPLPGAVSYDAATAIATFTPTANLTALTSYTAQVSGAKDLAGNALAAGLVANPWTFTTGAALSQTPLALGTTVNLGILATVTITNNGTTIVNGDVSLQPGSTISGTPTPQVNGNIDVNDAVSAQAIADMTAAYADAQALSEGTLVASTDLGAAYPAGMPAGIYTSAGAMLVSSTLTLDAGGDANAVWIFRIGTGLRTAANVVLANGAQAKNVFWVAGQSVLLGGILFNGTVVAGQNISTAAGTRIDGRLLSGATDPGSVSLLSTIIDVPAQ